LISCVYEFFIIESEPEPISWGQYTVVESLLKAREEKELADVEVEVLRKTLEAYRILADIMK